MATTIHQSAVVDKAATLGQDVQIGPFCTVGPNVVLHDRVMLQSHVVVGGNTEIGEGTEIFPFASLGLAPQDKKFKGEASKLVVGKHNVIREYTTMNPGTEGGGLLTKVGDNGLFMVSTHVAHDCIVGNNVVMANHATLAGHVQVGDFVVIGGLSAIHQFVRIGSHAMIGGMSGIESDVIPYGTVLGERAALAGLNLIGLKRRGFERDAIHALRHLYQELFEKGEGKTLADRVEAALSAYSSDPVAMEVLTFLQQAGSRAICQPRK